MTATRATASMFGPGDAHEFARVDHEEDGFVLRCRCGWASPRSTSAAVVGEAWDRHRAEVGVSDW